MKYNDPAPVAEPPKPPTASVVTTIPVKLPPVSALPTQQEAFDAASTAYLQLGLYMAALRSALSRPPREPQKIDQRPNGCWLACVAMLTGLSLDDLPPAITSDDPEPTLHNRVMSTLHRRGFTLAVLGTRCPVGFSIMSGGSPRNEHLHSVVALDGKLWHDPHPSRAGIREVMEYEVVLPIRSGWVLSEAGKVEPFHASTGWRCPDCGCFGYPCKCSTDEADVGATPPPGGTP